MGASSNTARDFPRNMAEPEAVSLMYFKSELPCRLFGKSLRSSLHPPLAILKVLSYAETAET